MALKAYSWAPLWGDCPHSISIIQDDCLVRAAVNTIHTDGCDIRVTQTARYFRRLGWALRWVRRMTGLHLIPGPQDWVYIG